MFGEAARERPGAIRGVRGSEDRVSAPQDELGGENGEDLLLEEGPGRVLSLQPELEASTASKHRHRSCDTEKLTQTVKFNNVTSINIHTVERHIINNYA